MKKIFVAVFMLGVSLLMQAQTNTKHLAFSKFTPGVVYFKDGVKLEAPLNYSLIWDKLLFMKGGEVMRVDKTDDISHAVIETHVFVPVGECFYQVIREGDDGLYFKYHGKLAPVGSPSLYGTTSHVSNTISWTEVGVMALKLELPAEYKVQVENEYFWFKNGKYTPFTTVKEICAAFPGHDKEIKAYLKESKNRLKSHQEYLDVLDYCISLR